MPHADVVRFAVEDFGTAALDQLRANTSPARNNHSPVPPETATTRADRPPRRVLVASATNIADRKSRRAQRNERPPIWVLRREAVAKGRKWIRTNCTVCAEPVFIHVEWEKPLVLCKPCRADRAARLQADREHRSSNALKVKGKGRWWPVSGGLPSLGKRR